MSTARRDLLSILPLGVAAGAVTPALLRSASLIPDPGADRVLIDGCRAFIENDKATLVLLRQINAIEEGGVHCGDELEAQLQHLYDMKPDLDALGEIPATTMAGLRAKAEAQLQFLCRFNDGRFESDERMIGGIILDLLRLVEPST